MAEERGTVFHVGPLFARVTGLESVFVGERVLLGPGVPGVVMDLEEQSVSVALLGASTELREGSHARRTERPLDFPCGPGLLGRVVTAIGEPLDGLGPINASTLRPLHSSCPSIAARQPSREWLHSGTLAIDAFMPIPRGAACVIAGDRSTGKTSLAAGLVLAQASEDVRCIYVAIGQSAAATRAIVTRFREAGVLQRTTVVLADESSPVAMRTLAPEAGLTLADFWARELGHATLVVWDDLNQHAAALGQLALERGRGSALGAFPLNVTVEQARLMDRACRLRDRWIICRRSAPPGEKRGLDGRVYGGGNGREIAELIISGFDPKRFAVRQLERDSVPPHQIGKFGIVRRDPTGEVLLVVDERASAEEAFFGRADREDVEVRRLEPSGGSVTAVAVIESRPNELSAQLAAELRSRADRVIALERALFEKGRRPAVRLPGPPVTGLPTGPVGRAVGLWKTIAVSLAWLEGGEFDVLEQAERAGVPLDNRDRRELASVRRLVAAMEQPALMPRSFEEEVLLLTALRLPAIERVALGDITQFGRALVGYFREHRPDLIASLRERRVRDDRGTVDAEIERFAINWTV